MHCITVNFMSTMECYKTFYYKRFTNYKYILITITSTPTTLHVTVQLMMCPKMGKERTCVFRSNIKKNVIWTLFKTLQNNANANGILIKRHIQKLCNTMSFLHVTTDRNTALNWKFAILYIEQFPLLLTADLSNQCHFPGLNYFDESAPIYLA